MTLKEKRYQLNLIDVLTEMENELFDEWEDNDEFPGMYKDKIRFVFELALEIVNNPNILYGIKESDLLKMESEETPYKIANEGTNYALHAAKVAAYLRDVFCID